VDTHGFTEMVFCLFAALGLRFSPRIRDLSDQLLYRMEGVGIGEGVRAEAFTRDLLRGKINEKLILRYWDDILRVAGSLKLGWTPASDVRRRGPRFTMFSRVRNGSNRGEPPWIVPR